METSTLSAGSSETTTFTTATLIGQVATLYLAQRIQGSEGETGTARFILDQLKGEQMAAIARAILDHGQLVDLVEIQLPQAQLLPYVAEYNLPENILTTQRATYLRNADCARPALLLANTGDDEAQSLNLIEPIGSAVLLAQAELWVQIAATGLELPDEQIEVWSRVLRALMELSIRSLPHVAEYVLRTRREVEDGAPLLAALGAALPALAMPRDTSLFIGLPEKFHRQVSRWKLFFLDAHKKRAPYLRKQTPAQTLLTSANLRAAFKKACEGDAIPDVHYPVIETFIAADSQWNEAAKALAEIEWEQIRPLFDGLRREKQNLGKLTQNFFDDKDDDLLSNDEREYLKGLAERNPSTANDEDRLFYELHRHQIGENRHLKAGWDKFAFGRPHENEDFLTGLALCLERLTVEDFSTNRRLKIRLDAKSKGDLKKLNTEAGLYFATRYNGLRELLGSQVEWEVGELLNFPALLEEWRKSPKYSRNRSEAKAALQLKFTLELQMDSVTQGQASGSTASATQLIWTFNPIKVTREFAADWGRLREHPLVLCTAWREAVSAKGRFQSVNINDVRTLVPAFGQNRGSFVGTYKAAKNLATHWEANLKLALSEELVSSAVEKELKELWRSFKVAYTGAIEGFMQQGLAAEALREQAERYAELLLAVCEKAVGDRNRTLLLQPLLRIGSVSVAGDAPTEIITPWHPLRMVSLYVKARRVRDLLKAYLTEEEVRFGDAGRLFFKDLREELAHPFYPEVVLGRYDSKPELLALSDTCGDYTLHESPVATDTETSDNPTESSKRVAELVARYLALQPHESANLSVVLYDCDSARLPQAVVDRIGAMHEEEEDVRCQIVLRHHDPKKLHPLYERIVEASDSDPDAYSTSEATRDFMARLRIGISADQAPAPNEHEGPPNDIVFLQDVIARHATVDWYKENAHVVPLMELVPAHWSRRRPAPTGDMKSVVYLCCPAQTREGWAYLTAITTFVKGNWDQDTTRRLLPARQLDFQDQKMSHIFEETHNLGHWVVNYDELLDRRQLVDRKVRVIRYKQSSTQGRSLIVSSTASLGLLQSMLQRRIASLDLGLDKPAQQNLTERFIAEANKISGDIVLRAARRGRSASELMGVVLSCFLIRQEMHTYLGGEKGHFGWYFLDDYAEWLGQREEQLADILMLSPSRGENGELRLTIIVGEAKFIDRGGLITGARTSRNQLRDTLKRINEALFGAPERLDRALWLARLSDLILDGVQFPAGAGINLADWRLAIRQGQCHISVRGYSHVFISGPENEPSDADFSQITEAENAYQEIFSLDQVRELVHCYRTEQDPMPVRAANGDPSIWASQTFVQPAAGATSVTITAAAGGSEASLPGNGPSSPPQAPATLAVPATVVSTPTGVAVLPTVNPRWAYPAIEQLLPQSDQVQPEALADLEWLNATALRTKAALQGFNLHAKLQQSKLTPNAALLTFQGNANLTVDQVVKRQVEFKTTYGLSVVSVRPESGAISLAIERPQRQVVRLEDIWSRWHPDSAHGNQTLAIAIREDNGEILTLSPQRNAPHTLIAGTTGSGKSVLVQNIILCIAATNTPEQAQMIIIDPKLGVDYFALEPLPHIKGGSIIVEQDQALEELLALVDEMEARYKLFREARAANITAYNKKVEQGKRLPVIWLIHDEFADWMQVDEYKQEVTSVVSRLGVKARAAGIYLVFAAQRPDANVMPMQLRTNLGNRLILKVDSEGTSEIALSQKGAERLLGKGHLLAKLEGEPDLVFSQVPFIQEEVIDQIVDLTNASA